MPCDAPVCEPYKKETLKMVNMAVQSAESEWMVSEQAVLSTYCMGEFQTSANGSI